MISEPELAALLYRADWTALSLAARVHRVIGFPDVMLAPPGEAVADAGHGFLLRVTSPAGRPAHRFELRDVTLTGAAAPADFRGDIPPGLPVTEESGGPLGDAELPEAVRLAGKAVTEVTRRAAAGASALASFLDSMRGKPPGRAG